MQKQINHISILVFLILALNGFQFAGQHAAIYASNNSSFSSTEIGSSISINDQSIAYLANDYRSKKDQQQYTEISEEAWEESEERIKTSNEIAISHTIYSSFLRFSPPSITNSVHYFDASTLVSSTPLFLRYEIFRL